MKLNILVFPCGSEIGLEVFRALQYSNHINLIGGSSVDDHGRFVYSNYVEGIPFVNDAAFINVIKQVVVDHKIDLIYPTMDSVIVALKEHENILCPVIGPPLSTVKICFSKKRTYETLRNVLNVPKVYEQVSEVENYPVFGKPDMGYGSRGVLKIESKEQLLQYTGKFQDSVVLEYLPGKEYTIDCFTNKDRKLLFVGSRERTRISNGISVRTSVAGTNDPVFFDMATKINSALELRGAWFFQVKEAVDGRLKLLEVATRLGGSSSVHRMQGVNFALLSVFDTMGREVEIIRNEFSIELDRALDSKFKIKLNFKTVYIDFDDTLLINNFLNTSLIAVLYQFLQVGKKIVLLTKHDGDIVYILKKLRIYELFDEIIHIKKNDIKSDYIHDSESIFIDDSFQERSEISKNKCIPVFSPDAMECFAS